MVVVVYLIMILAFSLVLISLTSDSEAKRVSVLEDFEITQRHKSKYFLGKILEKIGYINIPLLKALRIDRYYIKLTNRSGIDLTYFGFFTIKEMVALGCFFTCGLFGLNVRVILFLVVIGFFLPDLWLLRKIKTYQQDLLRVLPETVDLVNLCIGAGLDFIGAVKWIAGSKVNFKSALIEELTQARKEIDMGKARIQALIDMEKRLDIAEISSFVRILVSAEKLGIPVSEVLDSFCVDSREKRFHDGERRAKMAALKILFPLIFCILPTVAAIIIGPIFLQFQQQGFGGGLLK